MDQCYFVKIEHVKFIFVICSKLNIQSSGFGMTLSFDSALKYCGIWRFFSFLSFFFAVC